MTGTDRTDKLTGFEALGLLDRHPARRRLVGRRSPRSPASPSTAARPAPGHLFAALPGSRMHGAEFIPYALRMGAVAVLTDPAGLALAEAGAAPLPVPVVLSDNPRRALAIAARRFFGSQPEVMVAVTGTNGKTSVRELHPADLGGARRDGGQLRHRRRRGRGRRAAHRTRRPSRSSCTGCSPISPTRA